MTSSMTSENNVESSASAAGPRFIAVASGKGGAGKTLVAANLAAGLAQAGERVVAVDTNLEGANLHTCVGSPAPPFGLADYVAEREEDLGKLAVDTPIANLRLIAGMHANFSEPHPGHQSRKRLMESLREMPETDWVVLDLGPGINPAMLDYFLTADDAVIVVNAEPTSVESTYTFLRAAFLHRLRLTMVGHGVRRLVAQAMDPRNESGIRTPLDLLREVESLDPVEAIRFVEATRSFQPRIVVNGVRTADDVRLGFSMASVCRRYFGVEADYLGYINDDDAVRQSVSARSPVVKFAPKSDASVYFERIARKLVGQKQAAAEAG